MRTAGGAFLKNIRTFLWCFQLKHENRIEGTVDDLPGMDIRSTMKNQISILLFEMRHLEVPVWIGRYPVADIPQAWCCVAISGGMPALGQRIRDRHWLLNWDVQRLISDPSVIRYPFLNHASPWAMPYVVAAIIGPTGVTYSVFQADSAWNDVLGRETSECAATDYSRYVVQWSSPDLGSKCWKGMYVGGGMIVGFMDRGHEQDEFFTACRLSACLGTGGACDDAEFADNNGLSVRQPATDIQQILDGVDLLVVPYGWHRLDALVFVKGLDHDEIAKRIGEGIAREGQVIVAGDEKSFTLWSEDGRLPGSILDQLS